MIVGDSNVNYTAVTDSHYDVNELLTKGKVLPVAMWKDDLVTVTRTLLSPLLATMTNKDPLWIMKALYWYMLAVSWALSLANSFIDFLWRVSQNVIKFREKVLRT